MPTIGKTSLKLVADAGSFVKGVDQASFRLKLLEGAAKKFSAFDTKSPVSADTLKKLNDAAEATKKLSNEKDKAKDKDKKDKGDITKAAAFVYLAKEAYKGGKSLVDFAEGAAKAVISTTELSRETGSTTEGLIATQKAARDLGLDSGAVGDSFKALAQDIAQATSGNAGLADVFTRLGVSADDLSKLSVDKAFAKIADAISELDTPTERAAAATQLFGDNAKKILPLLASGSGSIDAAAKAADELGLSFSAVDGTQVELAAIAVSKLGDFLTAVGQQLAIQFAPYVAAVADKLSEMGAKGFSATKFIAKGVEALVGAFGFLKDTIRVIRIAFNILETGVSAVITALLYLTEKLLAVLATLPDKLGGGAFGKARDYVKELRVAAQQTTADFGQKVIDDFNDLGSESKGVAEFFNDIESRVKASEGIAKTADEFKRVASGIKEATTNADLFKSALAKTNELQSPFEKFNNELAAFNKQLAAEAISEETYAKGVGAAFQALQSANGLNQIKLPSAQLENSSGAVSAINRFNAESGGRESPQDQVKRVLEESREIAKRQLQISQRIADAIKNLQTEEVELD